MGVLTSNVLFQVIECNTGAFSSDALPGMIVNRNFSCPVAGYGPHIPFVYVIMKIMVRGKWLDLTNFHFPCPQDSWQPDLAHSSSSICLTISSWVKSARHA